ncbi:hypothetical protein SAMN04488594_0002, partial [Microbacterium azadirachtae]
MADDGKPSRDRKEGGAGRPRRYVDGARSERTFRPRQDGDRPFR